MTGEKARHDYSVFGLAIQSEIALPELLPSDRHSNADVVISGGSVPEIDAAPSGISAYNGALVFAVPGVARYLIADGRSITVDAEHCAPDRNVRLFLLGSALGALLHQRGLLPLHANAVEVDGRAVAFMGESGAGKSTLAAWFHDQGHRVIADDVCVVGFDASGEPYAAPGLPRLRLWAEALELMGRESDSLDRSYVGEEQYDKFDVPIDPDFTARTAIPLAGLYVLNRGEEFSVERLKGIKAAEVIFANTYRGAYVRAAGGQQNHWQASIGLIRSLPVFQASRVWDLSKLDDQSRRLLSHAQQLSEQIGQQG